VAAHKHKKNQTVKTGYYSRLEWPQPGGALEQSHLVVTIFQIIKDEEARMLAEKMK
jgi:hypothetical protein